MFKNKVDTSQEGELHIQVDEKMLDSIIAVIQIHSGSTGFFSKPI